MMWAYAPIRDAKPWAVFRCLGVIVLALVWVVGVSVLSRVSAMMSWPCNQDKARSRYLLISCTLLCILKSPRKWSVAVQ